MNRRGVIGLKKLALVALMAISLLTACGQGEKVTKVESEHEHQIHLANGDIQETTTSADILPNFMDGKPEAMRVVYEAAAKSADLLEWIPCYCGCGESAGHLNSLNCFVNKINEDGSVVWDDHGTRCDTCLEIAATSINMKTAGESNLEIRQFIDENYKEGYAEPTKTKMPKA
jgi:hypothetical protein